MANFTQAEIDAAVKNFIRTDVRTTRDPLGPRDSELVFQEIMEFSASSLVFDPNSVFYLIWLAKNRVNQDLNSAMVTLADLEQAILEVGRTTKAVTSTTLLADAAAALLEADRLITQKNTIAGPQFARYSGALDRFTELSLAPNIRNLVGTYPDTYEIVRPPQTAQTAIRSDIASLRGLHATILGETAQLSTAFSEFMGLNLSTRAIQTSVKRVQYDLKTLKSEFDASTEAEAIEKTRDAYLRIVAGRSVIENLTTMSDPSAKRMQGTTTSSDRAMAAYTDASSSTAARVVSSKSAPFHVIPGVSDQLKLSLDGGPVSLVTFSPPAPASIRGVNSDQTPFQIQGEVVAQITSIYVGPYTIPSVPDNVFDIFVDGVGYRMALSTGSRTTEEVAAELRPAFRIDGEPGTLADVVWVTAFGDALGFMRGAPGPAVITIGEQTVNAAFGFSNGQTAQGTDANNVLRLLVDDELEVLATLTTGSRTAAQVAEDIVSASSRVVANTYSLGVAEGVEISSKAYGEQSHIQVAPTSDIHRATMSVLGFVEGGSRSSYLGLNDAYNSLNSMAGVGVERSESVLAAGGGGITLYSGTYFLSLPDGSIPADFTVNDCLRITTGENAGSYFVESFTRGPDVVEVNRPFSVVTGDGSQNQQWELRRDLLVVKSITPGLTSTVEVLETNTSLGFSAGLVRGTTSGIRVQDSGKDQSFVRRDVRAGDQLSMGVTDYEIVALTENGYQIEVSPEVINNLSGQLYEISSRAALEHAAFLADLSAWQQSIGASEFKSDLHDLERKLNPLLYNLNPTDSVVNDAANSASRLRGFYVDLQSKFTEFMVAKVARIDALLDMLLERGVRRGYDLLLLGKFQEFFSASRDSLSYGGNMMEKMREVVQNDVPVSRGLESGQAESQLTGSFEDTDYGIDFSDGDDERAIAETDDIPEPDVDEQILTGF